MGEFDEHFKIIFNDDSYQMRKGTDYTKETVNAVNNDPQVVSSKIREIIATIFDNKENDVTSIEINVDCNIPFYTNNDNFEDPRLSSKYISPGLLFSNLPNLKSIVVHQSNPYFSSINGVLFSKNGKTLYTYPPGKSGNEYTIQSNVEKINCLSFMKTSNLNDIIISNTTTNIIWIAAFANATGLMRITIPDNITAYASYSFYKCKKLTTFTTSNTLLHIGGYAFYECSELLTVTIPNNINKRTVWFYYACFKNCYKLNSITLPDTTIFHENGYIFSDCISLTRIIIPDSVTIIPIGTFYSCSSLTSVTLPYTLTNIRSAAFSICRSLTSILFPQTLKTIEFAAFGICDSLTSVRIPASVTDLGNAFLSTCINLTSVTFDSGIKIKTLGLSCFSRCIKLNSITIPQGVTTIGTNCFAGTQALTTISLPSSITSVAENAFGKINMLNMDTLTNIANQYYNSGLQTLYLSNSSLLSTLNLTEGSKRGLYGSSSSINVIIISNAPQTTAGAAAAIRAAPAPAPAPTPEPALIDPSTLPDSAETVTTASVSHSWLIRAIIGMCMIIILLVVFSLMSMTSLVPSSFLSSSSASADVRS